MALSLPLILLPTPRKIYSYTTALLEYHACRKGENRNAISVKMNHPPRGFLRVRYIYNTRSKCSTTRIANVVVSPPIQPISTWAREIVILPSRNFDCYSYLAFRSASGARKGGRCATRTFDSPPARGENQQQHRALLTHQHTFTFLCDTYTVCDVGLALAFVR